MWTLDELVERVRVALGGDGYPGAPNGRVRDLPDRRAVRWYQTTGLVDRPIAMRGRVALYGPRHLLQLVAVKRRQADGRTLAEIQAELSGAPDETLAAVARVPAELLTGGDLDPDPAPARPRFWTAAAPRDVAAAAAAYTAPPAGAEAYAQPAAPEPPASEPATVTHPAQDGPAGPEHLLTGVPLGGGAILLLPGRPADGDVDAITAAARPLLDLLAGRGLIAAPSRPHPYLTDDPEPTHARAPRTHRSSS